MDKKGNKQTTGSIFDSKLVGREFGKYRADKLLSKHEFRQTITLLATNKETNERVVLKAFGTFSEKSKKEFEKEMAAFRKLEGAHGVLLPLETFEYEGDYFNVTEYKSGGDLRMWLETKPKAAEALDIFARIAESIDYVHENKIIHRDIKPENVVYEVVDGRITPYLMDFGISVTLPDQTSSFKTIHAFGTIEYMAPEFFLDMDGKKTKAVDIYAYGLMLYEALEGRHPFLGINQQETRDLIISGIVPTPEKTVKKFGENAGFMLKKALSKKPEDRPQTATEIIEQMGSGYIKYIGKSYGKYVIEEFLGRGAYGSTYKACELNKKSKKVAIKLLAGSRVSKPEISRLKELEFDKGILPIIDVGNENGSQYLVSEYLEGDDLRFILPPEGMEMQDFLAILKPLSKTLDYLHEKNIVHRDLKPENILFLKDKNKGGLRPFINDCGIFKIAEANYGANTNDTAFIRDLNYLAPEILEGREPSPAADVYSLGVIIYEAIEGKTPFNAKSLPALIKQKMDDDIPSPENLLKKAGIRAAMVLMRALSAKPEKRQISASALVSQLEDTIRNRTFIDKDFLIKPWETSRKVFSDIKRLPYAFWVLGFFLLLLVFGLFSRNYYQPVAPIFTSTFTPTIQIPATATPTVTASPAPSPTPSPVVTAESCTLPPDPLAHEYLVPGYLSLKEIYIKQFRREPDSNDLYALVYYNNRKILEGHEYHFIDPSRLEVEEDWKIIIPSQEWIAEYKKFPAAIPLLGQTDAGAELKISGSSVLSSLSAQISRCSAETIGVELKEIDSGSTVSGLRDLCQGKVDLFGANMEIDTTMMIEHHCGDIELDKFEIARYAMVIIINKNNPNADDMLDNPLKEPELTKLLLDASIWKDVRDGWINGESIARYYPSLESGEFEIVKDGIFPDSIVGENPEWTINDDSQTLMEAVAENDNAMGIVDYASYQNFENNVRLIAIPIDDVYVNSAIDDPDSKYPLMTPLYLYVEKHAYENDETIRGFVNYYLSHEMDFLKDLGYLYPSKQGYRDNRDAFH